MRYIDIKEPGGPEALQLCEGDAPVAAAGEVLIQVAAAGVNRPDVVQRKGLYPPPPGASPIPGLEVAGTVVHRLQIFIAYGDAGFFKLQQTLPDIAR